MQQFKSVSTKSAKALWSGRMTWMMAAVVMFFPALAETAPDECQVTWSDQFPAADLDGPVFATAVFDDGSGPALYVGGTFEWAGEVLANGFARWDGKSWSHVGDLIEGSITSIVADPDAAGGPKLYVGGNFICFGMTCNASVAQWDGQSWSGLMFEQEGTVECLALHKSPSEPHASLYAGGSFVQYGPPLAIHLARWDGRNWNPLGSGIGYAGFFSGVTAMTTFDDPASGKSLLVAAGGFTMAGEQPVSNIAAWDGELWSPLGAGICCAAEGLVSPVLALQVFEDELYAAGRFTMAGGVSTSAIARWDGTFWNDVGGGLAGVGPQGRAMTVFPNPQSRENQLIVAGRFTSAGMTAASRIASWNGREWLPLGEGFVPSSGIGLEVLQVTSFGMPDKQLSLLVGGRFSVAGTTAVRNLASWDGRSWQAYVPAGRGIDQSVHALTAIHEGPLQGIYAGGRFLTAGGQLSRGLSRWNGAQWESLDGGLFSSSTFSYVGDMAFAVQDPFGPALYVGGFSLDTGPVELNGIGRWDGKSWSALGGGVGGDNVPTIYAIVLFDAFPEGPSLIAGGSFTQADGRSAQGVARWDGRAWFPLGEGFNATVFDLAVYDDGTGQGEQLYAAGAYTHSGPNQIRHLAKWNGTAWVQVGPGVGNFTDRATGLIVFDDGPGAGPRLYVAGEFEHVQSQPANGLAVWDGRTMSPVHNPFEAINSGAMTVLDDGSGDGPALYVNGAYEHGFWSQSRVAKWNGQMWRFVGTLDPPYAAMNAVLAMAAHVPENGEPPSLIIGGEFRSVNDELSENIAILQGCTPSPVADLNGDGSINGIDLGILFVQWDAAGAADLNGNGAVDGVDLGILLAAWTR